MRSDLQHPNEYIRGSTLRFLVKIHETEILESLIPAITANLEHRHAYVRWGCSLITFLVLSSFLDFCLDAGVWRLLSDFRCSLQLVFCAFTTLFSCFDFRYLFNFLLLCLYFCGSLSRFSGRMPSFAFTASVSIIKVRFIFL